MLGRGGMATVYLCQDAESGNRVAVKVLRAEIGSAVVVERFLREIEFASRLDHPRIPKVLDSGTAEGIPFYVMTYIEGESLRDLLDRVKQLPIDEALSIAAAVTEPMTYAHRLGIVHRDIKPGNILIGVDGVRVLDFGIARAIVASADDRLTSTGIAIGTPAYMSPEQALGDHNLDARSDIYSLGCVVYEMIAGIPPFVGATPQARRFAAKAPPLSETRDGVPAHIVAAVSKSLQRTPADRWPTVREFADALSAAPQSEGLSAVRERVDHRRLKFMRGLAAILILAIAGAVGFTWTSSRRDAVIRGQSALIGWDLQRAEREFRQAVARNPDNARANVWLAQTLMLQGAPLEEWRKLVARAGEDSASLSQAELKRLNALARFAAASRQPTCDPFKELQTLARMENRGDLTPTLAYADCLRFDSTVVRDPTSPSGYRFSTSYHSIDSLYRTMLLRVSDNSRAYEVIVPRIAKILMSDPRLLRTGVLADSGRSFFAQPALISDSIAFIPYPRSETGGALSFGSPRSLDAARARNRQQLYALAVTWTQLSPWQTDSREMLAGILEADGRSEGEGQTAGRESLAAGGARGGMPDTYVKRVRLANTHVRNFVRIRDFRSAAQLADSVLAWRQPALDETLRREASDYLWRLAALRGHVFRVIEIEKAYAAHYRVWLPTGPEPLPVAVARDAISLSNFSAFGGPTDSILAVTSRLKQKVQSHIPPAKQDPVLRALLTRPLCLAAPVIGLSALVELGTNADPTTRALHALGMGNRKLARTYVDSIARLHSERPPGEVTMDATYLEAWLHAQLGDTAQAVRLLDNSLSGISLGASSMLNSPLLTASLVRAMDLRARLEDGLGHTKEASLWRSAVADLWGKGEPLESVGAAAVKH